MGMGLLDLTWVQADSIDLDPMTTQLGPELIQHEMDWGQLSLTWTRIELALYEFRPT